MIVPRSLVSEKNKKNGLDFLKSPPLTENKIGEARSTQIPAGYTVGPYMLNNEQISQVVSGIAAPVTSLKASTA